MKTSIRESLGICGDVDMFKIILVRKMHAYLLQCAKSQRTGYHFQQIIKLKHRKVQQ